MNLRLVLFAVTIGGAGLSCGVPEPAADSTASPTLVQDGRIADNGGGPAYEFTSIDQVLERGESVYVRQRGAQEIRVFSAEGAYLATIGRNGSGPGEFRELESMGFIGDTLWTIDGGLRRLSYFTADGRLLTTQPYEPISPSLGGGPVFFFPYFKTLLNDGSVLGFGGWAAARDLVAGRITATPQLRMNRAGKTLDTIAWVPRRNENMIIRSEHSYLFRVQPFGDAVVTVYSPESSRLYIVDGPAAQAPAQAQVTAIAIDINGDTAWVTTLPYEPVRLPAREVDSVRSAYHKAHSPRFTPEQVDQALYVPAFRPPVRQAISAVDGSLWIQWDDGTRRGGITVLYSDGRIRHQFAVGPNAKLLWASADHVWLESKDGNDVPSLARYRMSSVSKDK